MLQNYLLSIEELNNEAVESESPTTFNMNDVVNSAKDGNTELLEKLYQASKIKVIEYYERIGEIAKRYGETYTHKYCICTPKEGRSVIKENVEKILPTHEELVSHLVEFHNTYASHSSNTEEVSLDELNALHQETQEENSL